MSDLSDILPEFVRNRRIVVHDLFEKQAQMFEERVEEERQRELERIKQVMRNANDLPAKANLQIENAALPNPDLTELQKQLERNGERVGPEPSLECRIKNAAGG